MVLFNRNKQDAADTEPATGAVLTPDPELAKLSGEYTIDPSHSEIGFTARHAMVTNVRGSFQAYEGKLVLDGTDPSRSTAAIEVDMASVDTGSADRDGHLVTGDFFDTENFPKMTFRSTSVEQTEPTTYRVTGDLTIKGTTRPLSIDLEFNGAATDPFGNERVGFEGGTTILRSDWGLTWNAALEAGGVLVSDKIKLNFDISAIKNAPAA
ncbi:YceI family protein [Streptomyces sp. Ru87]|uniref:YceI family protein n=1 Tax=Streptomyces sp. Ru87 TaxID=2044307 RepID=UPI000BF87DFE|nr:YceI family protein [Streptomyces sp. Ru87]PGH52626.1 polyisoprenoid-binding protein [Streptomyces sp. Ru87]